MPPLAMAWAAVPAPAPPTHLLTRGDLDKPAEQVSAAGPSAVKTPAPEWGLNFDTPDSADPRILNEILWKSVKGVKSVMPAPRHNKVDALLRSKKVVVADKD